jgi:ABC-type Fe3+ transport system substrate-binding protein
MKKSWREKLATNKDLPKTMVIPAPSEVDALMKHVPRGRVVTINELRAALAKKHRVDFACPLTTGIFSWIAAHAAAEAGAEGARDITPYWRTLKTGGELNPKYPGGNEGVARRLRAEGHKVIFKGKRALVVDYEQKLFAGL